MTDQKLLDDVRAVQKRGSAEFKVELDADLLHQRQEYKGALSIEEMSAIIDGML